MLFVWLVLVLQTTWITSAEVTPTTSDTCTPRDRPADLGSGSLDQLVDVILSRLLTNQSVVRLSQTIEVSHDVWIDRLVIYNLASVHRTCPISLRTDDPIGCYRRGLLLGACFGFDQLHMNISLRSWVPGLRNENFHVVIKSVSVQVLIELFALFGENLPPGIPLFHQVARIVELKTLRWNGVVIKPVSTGVAKTFLSWLTYSTMNLFSRPFVQRMDWTLKNAINEKLRTFTLHPISASLKQSDHRAPVTQPEVRVKRSIEKPSRILALPIH